MGDISQVCFSQETVPASIKQGTPTDDELEELGEKIAGKWQKLGRRLDINDPKLHNIHQAHDQLSERGYHMLMHWKQDNGSAATYQALFDALKHKLVQRQDLAEQFCCIQGTIAIHLPAGPIPETGKISVANAGTCHSGVSSRDQDNPSRVISGLKRKRSKTNPEQGNLSFKVRCASAISRNSKGQDSQEAREEVDRYMRTKIEDATAKGKFDFSSHKDLYDFYAYLVGHLQLMDVNFHLSSIKITANCRTLEILELLWDDYRSGHLNAKAEECLITEKFKGELDMETITLTTTILEQDYLACKLSLNEISVEAYPDDGQVELRGDLESREHELQELKEPTEVCKPIGDSECSKQEDNDATDNNTNQKRMVLRSTRKTKKGYQMPIEMVLRAFAEENFSEDHYYPVFHGQELMIKPLGLVVKKRRSIFKRLFAKSEFIVIGNLEDFVVKDKRRELIEAVNSIILKKKNLETVKEEDEEGIGVSSHVAVKLEAAKSVKVNVKVTDDLGELELGKLDQEYFKDPDLRDVLARTALDANRMEGLEDQKLRLIYLVIYSERFLLKGKRKHEIVVDAGVKAALPEVAQALAEYAQLKGQYKKQTTPSKAAARNKRSPVFFKFVRVDYDKENGRLKLSEGEFAGRAVSAYTRNFEKDKAEYKETIVGMEKEDSDLSEPLMTDVDYKKLQKIMESGLMAAETSREKRKERVKKYLNWFEEALIEGQQKISLDEPLNDEDSKFLRSIYCSVLPNQSIVDLTSFDTGEIQGYFIVLKQIDDLSDEHWDEIENAWAQTGQNK